MQIHISLTLVCLYRTPRSKLNKSTNKMFLDQFPVFLHSLSDRKRKITVVGDFNFHFANEHDSEVCKLRSLLNDCCLKELVNQQTQLCVHTFACGIKLDSLELTDISFHCLNTGLSPVSFVWCNEAPSEGENLDRSAFFKCFYLTSSSSRYQQQQQNTHTHIFL